MSAARDYQDVVDGLTAAADELRDRDRDRAAELARRLVELDDDLLRADERAALTRMVVALHWEAALESLWAESWLTLRPHPAPAAHVDPAGLAEREADVERAAEELQQATRRRRFGWPGR